MRFYDKSGFELTDYQIVSFDPGFVKTGVESLVSRHSMKKYQIIRPLIIIIDLVSNGQCIQYSKDLHQMSEQLFFIELATEVEMIE